MRALAIALALLMPLPLAARARFIVWSNTVQTPAYFGHVQSDGSPPAGYTFDFYGARTWYNNTAVTTYTCPGTGSRTLEKLGLYAKTRGSPHGNVRLAVYDTSLNLICEGSAEILINSATEQWWDHVAFTGTPTLTGGTNYIIAASIDSSLISYAYTSVTNASKALSSTDYTGGYPDPIGAGSTDSIKLAVRAYVTGGGGGGGGGGEPTMEVYYVDPSESGSSQTGTTEEPYLSLNACLAAKCNKTFTLPIQIRCRTSGSTADTVRVYDGALGQFVASADNYLEIVAETGHRAGTVWDATKYHLTPAFIPGSGAGTALALNHNYIRIDGLQIGISSISGQSGEAAELCYLAQASTGYMANCLIKGSNVSNSGANNILRGISSINGINVYNTIIDIRTSHAGNQGVKNHSDSNLYSCTIMAGAGTAVDVADNSHIVAKNCYMQGDYLSLAVTATNSTLTQTTCATSDTLSTVSGLRSIAVNTTNFTNVTANSENWSLPSGSALIDVGTDTSGDAAPFNFTTDIDGDTRSGTWDIGAHEY